jgi:hypothetical protein
MTQSDSEPDQLPKEARDKCSWQKKNCRQTAEAFQIWSESLSRWNAAWLVATVLVTAMTILQMLLGLGGDQTDLISGMLILVTAAALAGYLAFNRPVPLDEIRDVANQFQGLSDQFEHAASMPKEPKESHEELMARFHNHFTRLLDQKSRIWQTAPLVPQSYFAEARQHSDDSSQQGPSPQSPVKSGFVRRIRSWLSRRFESKGRPPAPG